MAKKMRVLVFPCGTEIGLEIFRAFVGIKGADKAMEIREIVLERKSGGKSGEYRLAKKK